MCIHKCIGVSAGIFQRVKKSGYVGRKSASGGLGQFYVYDGRVRLIHGLVQTFGLKQFVCHHESRWGVLAQNWGGVSLCSLAHAENRHCI